MNVQPEISVLMPVYNAAETLPAALESMLAQEAAAFEILAFEDGSTDGTADVLEGYAARDPRLRVVRSKRVGIVAALRRLAVEARGRYLARMDADDVAHPARLSRQRAYLERYPDVAVCGTRVRIVGTSVRSGRRRYERWLNGLLTPEDHARELFVECPIPHPTFFMRRDAFDAVGGYRDAGWPEDYDLLMRVHRAGYGMGKVDELLLDWRHRAGRTSEVDPRYAPERFRDLKRTYLTEFHFAHRETFHQWGAGNVGKQWLKTWNGRKPAAVVDVHPRKIGVSIHGVDVIAPEQLPPPGRGFTVVAVGAPGARAEIRAWFSSRGYEEVRDYLFLA